MLESKVLIKETDESVIETLTSNGINPKTAELLYHRGITNPDDALEFLNPSREQFYSPDKIKNIGLAFERIKKAIIQKEHVSILGDYDVDGITATAIMVLGLRELGAMVDYRLPDRIHEGFGLSVKAVEDVHQRGCNLIITVDNGITAIDAVKRAKSLGIDVIVLDHHTPGNVLPEADIIIDLHMEDNTYPYVDLAGCGLAWKVMCYIYEQLTGVIDPAMKLIDLAAIGTVADVVPLVDENRAIVAEGLRYINSPHYQRSGVRALLDVFNHEAKVDSTTIGFKIGPALNAPGRLLVDGANLSLGLILSDSITSYGYAERLFDINEKRKEITYEGVLDAEEYISDNALKDDRFLVLFLPNVAEGIVGIISGKITERYYRPSIVFTEGQQCFKASARSIPGVNLYKELSKCDDLLAKWGGHAQAAGMSIDKNMQILKELRQRLNSNIADIDEEQFVKKIYVDRVIQEREIDWTTLRELEAIEPCGQMNPKPVLLVKDFYSRKQNKAGWDHYRYMGKDECHIRIDGHNSAVVWFYAREHYERLGCPRDIDVIGTLQNNTFNGTSSLQIIAEKITPAVAKLKKRTNLQQEMKDAIASLL